MDRQRWTQKSRGILGQMACRSWVAAIVALLVGGTARSAELEAIFAGGVPESLQDLKAMEAHVKTLTKDVIPATVGLQLGPVQGSGVIISPDGYVLTAGHVSGPADRSVRITTHQGTILRGKTLGSNRRMDSGMIKITSKPPPGGWPYVKMAESGEVRRGQWVLATGHPNGYQRGRTPPVRLGRILRNGRLGIVTDCTLVGGDSGGPLFDFDGKVVGIHSRISEELTSNVHVPIATYHNTWDRLADGEMWSSGPLREGAYLGVQADLTADGATVADVASKGPAARAGIQAGDVIIRFDGESVDSFGDLVDLVSQKKPGDRVSLRVLRGDRTVSLNVTLGRWK